MSFRRDVLLIGGYQPAIADDGAPLHEQVPGPNGPTQDDCSHRVRLGPRVGQVVHG
jgi:hypothetical protein